MKKEKGAEEEEVCTSSSIAAIAVAAAPHHHPLLHPSPLHHLPALRITITATTFSPQKQPLLSSPFPNTATTASLQLYHHHQPPPPAITLATTYPHHSPSLSLKTVPLPVHPFLHYHHPNHHLHHHTATPLPPH